MSLDLFSFPFYVSFPSFALSWRSCQDFVFYALQVLMTAHEAARFACWFRCNPETVLSLRNWFVAQKKSLCYLLLVDLKYLMKRKFVSLWLIADVSDLYSPISGPKVCPNGVDKNSEGKSKMYFGMLAPHKNWHKSSENVLQLCFKRL